MRLYRISATITKTNGNSTESHRSVRWLGTQGECSAHRKELNSKHKVPRDQITTDEVEVPTDKKGLLEWLNANARG